MNHTTANLSLPTQPQMRFAVASASKAQLRNLWAAVALCAAIVAATPAFSETRTDHKNNETPVIGVIHLEDRGQFANTAVIPVSKTVLPKAKTLITAFVAYFPSTCVEAGPGSWKVTKLAKFGSTTVAGLKSNLSGGACPGKKFNFSAIYYTWTKVKVKPVPKTDTFSATWSYKTLKEPIKASLKLK